MSEHPRGTAFAAPALVSRRSPAVPSHGPRTAKPLACAAPPTPARIVLLPDQWGRVGASPVWTPPAWYNVLRARLSAGDELLTPSDTDMPNPYADNTKRWEKVWLDYIHYLVCGDSTRDDQQRTLLVGHGTGADAALRYAEVHTLNAGALFALPGGDEYYAGERHGRPYHWCDIRRNVSQGRLAVILSDACASAAENETLRERLAPDVACTVPPARRRCSGSDASFDELSDALQHLLHA